MAEPLSLYTSYNNDTEDREAFNIIKEKSRELASKFSNVKFEFSDLDGLRWRRRPSRTEQCYTSLGQAMQGLTRNTSVSTESTTPRKEKRQSTLSIQLRPGSIITPPLRAGQKSPTGSYFPPQRRSSLGKAAAGIKRSLSFKRKKDSQTQSDKPVPDSESAADDCVGKPYTGGTALYRAGYSTFVSETGVYEDSDSDSSSVASTQPDQVMDMELEDDTDLTTSTFPGPIKLPTVPTVPALELDLSQALTDSLDPDADISTLPPPALLTATDPNATIKPRPLPIPQKRSILSPGLPFFCGSPSQKNTVAFPSTRSPCCAYPAGQNNGSTTSLSTVSVQITFSPTLSNAATAKNEAHGFWSTSCVSKDSEGTIRPIARRRVSVPGLADAF
ncbi:hypothetical protein AAF712_013292 [Marasmius tenuissimus]|uniref:Uncharacterized protein n=1 Tax=Marasmius tenuissimus TaxID=585030 RepID=A0ABR2ZGS0_9AGAR